MSDSYPNHVTETLNRAAFCGEPALPCDAGSSKIKGLASLSLFQKFPGLFDQRSLSESRSGS
jgi:hypothetical protein